MTPYHRAKARHLAENCRITFEEAIFLHALTGYVVITPEVFLLFRPVDSRGDSDLYDDPSITFADPDTWFVYLAAGDASQFESWFPFDLPNVAFIRKKRLHFTRYKKTARKLTSYGRRKTSGSGPKARVYADAASGETGKA